MMKNFKKSEIVVYVVALMLVTAGYFNYTATDPSNLVETYSEDIHKLEDTANTGVGDAVLVSNNEADSADKKEDNTVRDIKLDEVKEENNTEISENVALVKNDDTLEADNSEIINKIAEKSSEDTTLENNPLNNIDASANIKTDEANYYASSKLERDKMYANMLSTYQNILDNNNVSETQKSIASKEITKINNTKNSIMICENLIMTKKIDNCVILINENSVNIVVNVKDGLTSEKVAQIQNIVSRELGTEVENIHIMEK